MRDRNRRTVKQLFQWLDVMEIESWVGAWADNGVLVFPFAPEGFPKRIEGKAAIREHCGGIAEISRYMRISDLEIHDMLDPERLLVTYGAEIGLVHGGTYTNTYVVLFTMRGGQIAELCEYYDPIRVLRAFGGLLPGGAGAEA
jgi:ketosteroid isomerase-like protein